MDVMDGFLHWLRTGTVACACYFMACVAVHAQPQGGVPVSFNSLDGAGASMALRGVLYKPAGDAKGAVVLVHGSGGWSDHREGHYARALSAAGYVALALDSFGPRGIGSTVEDQSRISTLQMTRDAFAARRFLIEQNVPPRRIAVAGFSKGSTVALYAADRNFLPAEKERFAAAAPFYPSSTVRSREPLPASPVFMALGEKDDYTGVKPCQALAADFAGAGGKIDVKVYPGASHAFDGNPAHTRLHRESMAENFMDCVVLLEPDGRQSYDGKTYASTDPSLLDALRKTCVKKGASLWSNPGQRDVATRDLIEFLDANLTR
ncbi:dienelactone hydrolase family protein [Variovorax rhizosphaerae]|uniref:Dienelactone hydrolase family protein n=1 Tax=Variovorax rhizosphaerae TaxID=1836200 RepID=A0ABU8WJ89_9BURK